MTRRIARLIVGATMTLCAVPLGAAVPASANVATNWRTINWNICTNRVVPDNVGNFPKACAASQADTAPLDNLNTREAERYYLAKKLAQAATHSLTLQEVCEADVRWIAAYIATGSTPTSVTSGAHEFTSADYALVEASAPYAFVPGRTREMLMAETVPNKRNLGCGAGVGTGNAVVAKNIYSSGAPVRYVGFRASTYPNRTDGVTWANVSYNCEAYLNYQETSETQHISNFRTLCNQYDPQTGTPPAVRRTRGVACVSTRWRRVSTEGIRRLTTCSSHVIGDSRHSLRELQTLDAAGIAVAEAGTEPLIMSGDFNASPSYPNVAGHEEIMNFMGFEKMTSGSTHRTECDREIDAIYGNSKVAFTTPAANPDCEMVVPGETNFGYPDSKSFTWSDHMMLTSPLFDLE